LNSTTDTVRCGNCGQEFSAVGLFCPACGTAKARNLDGDPLLGARVGDRYLIIERLGHGASGTIYRGEHVTLHRKVAVKVLHHELSRDDLAMERFRREATTVGEIDNEHIVQIFDFGRCDDGRLYLAMELLEGETLDAVLARDKRLAVDRAVDILIQLGEALMEAHAMGYLHRDLRPRNVFLASRRGKANFVKLLDFGLSKLVEKEGEAASTSLGMTFGEPKYMSPEQARGDPVDRRADIYSLGCIAFEMLTGQPPFTGGKVFDILSQHVEASPPPPSQLRADVPRWLDTAVLRMLAKRPDDRFITVYRLVEALRQGNQSGAVMPDEVARRRETDPPPSVSRAMAKAAASAAARESVGKETVKGRPLSADGAPVTPAPAPAPVDDDDTERVDGPPPDHDDDLRATVRREPRARRPSASGKGRSASSSSSGLSAAWYADGEDLGDAGEAPVRRARTDRPPSRTFEDDVYAPERNRLPWIIGAILVVAVVVVAVALSMRSPKKKATAGPPPAPAVVVDAGVAMAPPADAAAAPAAIPDAAVAVARTVDAGSAAGHNPQPHDRPPGDGSHHKPDPSTRPDAGAAKPPDDGKDEDRAQATFYAQMGQTNLRDGDVLGAAGNFNKALALDPNNSVAVLGLGEIALEQGSYQAAIGHLKRATRLASKNARAWTLLGEAYLNSGDKGQAASAFKQALKLDPGSERARNGYEDATGGG